MRIQCPNCQLGLEIVPDTPSKEILCPSCGSQLDLTVTTETVSYNGESRRTIGHFELLEQVGQGHFGAVWRARDTKLQRIVAIKIPRTADLAPAEKELFFREARTAAKLRHTNIVPVHEVGNEDGTIFIVSDFIPGITLAEKLRIGNPTFQQSAQWCATVADALDYAHENGVIHRDMKPGNVMLEKDKPYVLDFGLAKHEASDFTITTEGEILGTPAYMSPEQARGASGSADRRCDVYSIGTVLYQMLTGRKPFQGGTRALMHQILHDEPTAPRRIDKTIPRDLETICLRAMAKEPGRRYATAKEMAEDLRRYLAGEPIHARPVQWYERSWRWARRNSALSLASGIAGLAVMVLMVLGVWAWFHDDKQLVHLEILKRETAEPSEKKLPAKDSAVVFWPMDPDTGELLLDHPVRVNGQHQISPRLRPGDYLVVVNIPGHGFHEVFRHVPAPEEPPKGAYNHQFFTFEKDGSITLPAIEVPPHSVEVGMAAFPEGDFSVRLGRAKTERFVQEHVASFLMDAHEMTIGDYQKYWTLHQILRDAPEPDNHPVHHVNWMEAMAYAEKIGKRLPEQVEYDASATNYGKQKHPWGDALLMGTSWPLGAIGTPEYDRTKTDPPVTGLSSNVGEWMRDWADVPKTESIRNPEASVQRVARGAPESVLLGVTKNPQFEQSSPTFHYQKEQNPGLGFRCVRSAKPRLTRQDFSTKVESR